MEWGFRVVMVMVMMNSDSGNSTNDENDGHKSPIKGVVATGGSLGCK